MAERATPNERGVESSISEINRRDFGKTATGAYAVYAAGNSWSALAASADDLAKMTISEASRRLHSKEITSTQLTQACLDRSKIYNPKVNAYITLMHEEALAHAAQLDNGYPPAEMLTTGGPESWRLILSRRRLSGPIRD